MANAPPLPPNGKAAGVVARSRQPRPKQQPSFEVCKKNALGKLDKSPKGSLDQPIGGVSSFGYSGTIAHTVVGVARFARAFELEPLVALRFDRRLYTWREAPHSLAQERSSER